MFTPYAYISSMLFGSALSANTSVCSAMLSVQNLASCGFVIPVRYNSSSMYIASPSTATRTMVEGSLVYPKSIPHHQVASSGNDSTCCQFENTNPSVIPISPNPYTLHQFGSLSLRDSMDRLIFAHVRVVLVR